jgi:hypothetical protein
MDDALAGRHPVDRAGLDPLHRAERVAVLDRAVEEVGEGGEADVRMGPHVVAGARIERHRAEVVEEDEGPDAPPVAVRQRATHGEAAAEVLLHGFEGCLHRRESRGRLLESRPETLPTQ